MFDLLKRLTSPHTAYLLRDGDGGGGDGDGGGKGDGDGSGDKGPTKEAFDALTAENAKGKQALEDMRMEIYSPEYLKYLQATEKDKKDGDKPPVDPLEGIDLEKLSKKELFALATKHATDAFDGKLSEFKKTYEGDKDTRTKKEIKAFASKHPDFETYRPVMQGLATDPKNADDSIATLFEKAKEHVKRIHTEPSAEEKARQAKLGGEKPDNSSGSKTHNKKLTADEAAKEAVAEVEQELGPLPTG